MRTYHDYEVTFPDVNSKNEFLGTTFAIFALFGTYYRHGYD